MDVGDTGHRRRESRAPHPPAGARPRALPLPRLVEKELIPGSRHCPPTTDAFRRWLADRIGGFLTGQAGAASAAARRAG